ncbi:MAG: hypothetical protein GY834_08370 [Bacteroidetes bacterium]|nr:hypothetical protein [Bacteroidota bacterium]
MKTVSIHSKSIVNLLRTKKIATKEEISVALGTSSRATMFLKLKELEYLSSYSHSGKYYSLKSIVNFNSQGIWSYLDVYFSKYGTLLNTIPNIVNESHRGLTVYELEQLLNVKVANQLFSLVKNKILSRKKYSGVFVYYSQDSSIGKQQELNRKDSLAKYSEINEPVMLKNELKASLVLFFSLLDEQQRRIYAGFESLKHGYGGDRLIAKIFGINEKTVARGRKELLEQKVLFKSVRKDGGGRKIIQKKRAYRNNRKNNEI